MDNQQVLVVEDEVDLARVIAGYLQNEGFTVRQAHTGPDAVALAQQDSPALIVLDLMLPGFDGIEVCRQIRGFSDCYIIMLTARDDEIDKVLGLSMGADDYLVKPFSPRELMARVRAMLRRPRQVGGSPAAPHRQLADLDVDPEARKVWVSGAEIDLTRTEFDLLDALSEQPRRAFTRRQLIDHVWGEAWYGDEHIVDVHVGHLRKKLGDDAGTPRFIRTVRGIGYGMVT
ncbi:MAG: response regulator transcription factor [Candidatus Nanopelagicales bacterium]